MPLENKIHIFAPSCNILYVFYTPNDATLQFLYQLTSVMVRASRLIGTLIFLGDEWKLFCNQPY